MTKDELVAMLPDIKDELGIKKQESFKNYLDTLSKDEMLKLSAGVEDSFGVNKDEFFRAIMAYLIQEAKPWVKDENDIVI